MEISIDLNLSNIITGKVLFITQSNNEKGKAHNINITPIYRKLIYGANFKVLLYCYDSRYYPVKKHPQLHNKMVDNVHEETF